MRRTTWTALAAVTLALGLAGCTTSAAPKPDPTSSVASPAPSSSTVTTVGPTVTTNGPIVVGPTTTADGACPFLTLAQALSDVGERLGRVTVSTSGGAPVGCTFYPASGALASSEHLPPSNVPVLAITLSRFASDDAAHNAMVLSSRVDPAAYSDPIPGADEAIAFAKKFDPGDGDRDRAFTFRKGTTVALIQVAQTTSFPAKQVGTNMAAKVS